MSERGGSKLPFLEGKSEQWPEWKPHFMGLIGDSEETLYDMLNGTTSDPKQQGNLGTNGIRTTTRSSSSSPRRSRVSLL